MVIVTDLGIAIRALETILEQGEGSPVRRDKNHYAYFKEIYDNYDADPLQYHDVVPNIDSKDYQDQQFYAVSLSLSILSMCRI